MGETRERVFEVIKAYRAEFGWGPTYNEIGERIPGPNGEPLARSSVQLHIKALVRAGRMVQGSHSAQLREVEVTQALTDDDEPDPGYDPSVAPLG